MNKTSIEMLRDAVGTGLWNLTRVQTHELLSDVRCVVNHRYERLKAKGYYTHAMLLLDSTGGKITSTVQNETKELIRANTFLVDETSTVKGFRDWKYRTEHMLGKQIGEDEYID